MASFAGDRRYLSVAFTPGSENFFRFKGDAWVYQGSCPSSGDTAESSFHYWLNSFSQVSRFATYSYIQFFAACTVVVTCKTDGRWVSSPAARLEISPCLTTRVRTCRCRGPCLGVSGTPRA